MSNGYLIPIYFSSGTIGGLMIVAGISTDAWGAIALGALLVAVAIWCLTKLFPSCFKWASAVRDGSDFEDWFGTEEEHRQELERMKRVEEQREAECVAGTRRRCRCGAPSIFVDEAHGPLCAPCGYDYAN